MTSWWREYNQAEIVLVRRNLLGAHSAADDA